ncbi:MAG: hypothetical protein M0003_04220 [Acidithiobacillus sp.]|nr:hypothetical protein [Acidithiobacillus sp.]
MSNVHPFPVGGKSAKTIRKNDRRANSNHAAHGPELLLQGIDDHPIDVLDRIIQAGSLYLSPSDARPDEKLEDTPSAQFMRTIQGMNALTDATNVLIHQAKKYRELMDQESVDGLVQRAKAMQKLIRKLDEMLPQDGFILSSDSFGPDMLAEYATNAAMLVVSDFAVALLDYYDARFIQTRRDQRKIMMIDFQDAYREVIQDCRVRMDAHNYLMKELASAQRALNKVMKEP